MQEFYNDGARHFQKKFETLRLADRAREVLVHDTITDEDRAFIERKDFFFLATVDRHGQPQCSYKGGERGFIKVLGAKTLAFPCYDGNGMYLSMGNICETRRVGMLFIDFEDPHRLRVNGVVAVKEDDPLLAVYHEAQLIVRVTVTDVFVNCPRYIHRFKRIGPSPFVPKAGCTTPVPDWKRAAVVQDVLPLRDKLKLAMESTKKSSDRATSIDENTA